MIFKKNKPIKRLNQKSNSFMLGKYDVAAIMREVAGNAWNYKEPRKISLIAGGNVVDIEGYIYEPSHENFLADASISLNRENLYRKEYPAGIYDTPEEAVSHIKRMVQNQEFYLNGVEEAGFEIE